MSSGASKSPWRVHSGAGIAFRLLRAGALCLGGIGLTAIALLFLAPLASGAGDAAAVTYRRVFKNSSPEFIEIKVGSDGPARCEVRQLSDAPGSEPMEVGPDVREKIFQLAGRLQDFQTPLEAKRKMANLGQKTLRYEKGTEVHEVQFNYTDNKDAVQLTTIFEGLAQQQQDLDSIESKLKYDRLGVNDALGQLQKDLEHATLPEPDRLLPVLDKAASDSRVVEVARSRARALAERIRIAVPGAAPGSAPTTAASPN